jgi:hypothetical protein
MLIGRIEDGGRGFLGRNSGKRSFLAPEKRWQTAVDYRKKVTVLFIPLSHSVSNEQRGKKKSRPVNRTAFFLMIACQKIVVSGWR